MAKGDKKEHSIVFEEGFIHIVYLKDGVVYGAKTDFDNIKLDGSNLADNEAFDLVRSAWYRVNFEK